MQPSKKTTEKNSTSSATPLVRVRKTAYDLLARYAKLLNISKTDAASLAIMDWAMHTAEARVRYNERLEKRRSAGEKPEAPPAKRPASVR